MRGTIPGKDVRELREALTLTVPQFAAMLGVHPNSVHRWERLEAAPVEGVPLALLSSLRRYVLVKPSPKRDPAEVGREVQNRLAIGGLVLALAFLFVLLAGDE
jgi:transcriptional regulator with XRE-family HTH domain